MKEKGDILLFSALHHRKEKGDILLFGALHHRQRPNGPKGQAHFCKLRCLPQKIFTSPVFCIALLFQDELSQPRLLQLWTSQQENHYPHEFQGFASKHHCSQKKPPDIFQPEDEDLN